MAHWEKQGSDNFVKHSHAHIYIRNIFHLLRINQKEFNMLDHTGI